MIRNSVIIVDDDRDIVANLRDILTEFGYNTDVAYDGPSALQRVAKKLYDIVLLDFKMPGMDGATLYEKIREIQPSIVAIMVTAHAGSNGVQRALNAGTSQVLRKPVDVSCLLECIERATRQPVVLIVDDDREFCENAWQIFRENHFRVALAYSHGEAKEKLRQQRFDVVVLDLVLGQTPATDTFQFLLGIEPSPATVLITGNRSKSVLANQMVSDGAKGVHFKPIDMDSLLKHIDALTAVP